jgi:cysteine desulfurase / selenocysteine lyase
MTQVRSGPAGGVDTVVPRAADAAPTAAATASGAGVIDPQAIRADFPIFERDFGGRRLAYLDSAATALKPQVVVDAVTGYLTRYSANVHRGIYTIGEEATAAYERSRATIGRFINAPDAHEIVMVRNASEAINLVAHSWGRRHIRAADTIVLTELEHHSNLVPWQLLAQEKDADLEFVAIDDDGVLIQRSYEVLLRTRPRLVAFNQVSNGLGTINPTREMIAAAHEAGALVLVDGAQAVPHLKVDVQDLDSDFYAFSGHKMCGPTGIGILHGKASVLERMSPYKGGGDMILSVTFEKTTYNTLPHIFEAGTPPIAGAVGIGAAVDYLSAIGMDAIAAHEHELVEYATAQLSRMKGVRIIGTAAHKASVISFTIDGVHPHDVGTLLNQEGIAVRTGHHCAQPVMQRFQVPATSRASFALYNTMAEVDALIAGIRDVQKVFA